MTTHLFFFFFTSCCLNATVCLTQITAVLKVTNSLAAAVVDQFRLITSWCTCRIWTPLQNIQCQGIMFLFSTEGVSVAALSSCPHYMMYPLIMVINIYNDVTVTLQITVHLSSHQSLKKNTPSRVCNTAVGSFFFFWQLHHAVISCH